MVLVYSVCISAFTVKEVSENFDTNTYKNNRDKNYLKKKGCLKRRQRSIASKKLSSSFLCISEYNKKVLKINMRVDCQVRARHMGCVSISDPA